MNQNWPGFFEAWPDVHTWQYMSGRTCSCPAGFKSSKQAYHGIFNTEIWPNKHHISLGTWNCVPSADRITVHSESATEFTSGFPSDIQGNGEDEYPAGFRYVRPYMCMSGRTCVCPAGHTADYSIINEILKMTE